MDIENVIKKNVSYLHARDPSILAWNVHGLDRVKINLDNLFDTSKNSQTDTQNHIQVFLRIKDGVSFDDLYEMNGDNLICKVPKGSYALRHIKEGDSMTKTYSFSKIFGSETTQIEIFNSIVKPKVLSFINGQSSTLMTYGASGSGKTFTIMGTPEEPGLIPRALEYVFRTIPKLNETPKVIVLTNGEVKYLDEQISSSERKQKSAILNATQIDRSVHIKTYKQMQQRLSSESVAEVDELHGIRVSIWVSFAEIYNENIYDLLKPTPTRGHPRPNLKLGNSNGSCYIKDLTSVNVGSGLEAYQVLQYGLHNLNYAATSVNSHSSRSHCIFTMKLVQLSEADDGVFVSTFNFCDLAGSERVKKTMNAGKRLKESNNINTSLLVLGRCISTIRSAQQLKDNRLVPFRESKLTQLFQKALTGLEDITMIVNMNPARDMFDETQHVLNFAAVAKEILIEEQQKIVKPKKNRFSQYMERKSLSVPFMQIIEEDEKDIEINKLKIMISDLYMEMEQKRLEYQQELSEEREYIRSEYKKFIEELRERHMQQKVEAINKVKREYEEIIQSLNRNRRCLDDSEVVILDSSSDEDDASERTSKQVIRDLERITTEQNDKIKLLEQNLKCQNEKSNKEISELKEHIRALKEEEFKLKVTLDEAEQAYSELQLELREADTKTKKLISEKLQLQEKVEQLEEVITHLTNDSDESEDDPCQIEHVVGS